MNISTALGGLAGACALTILNQVVRKIDKDAPRLDLLGMNAVAKIYRGADVVPPVLKNLLPASLAGDLISNSLYYGMAKGENKSQTYFRGAFLGLIAGLGAVSIPQKLGLNEDYTARTSKTKAMTVLWYMVGGLVAAAVINATDKDMASEAAETTKHSVAA